MAIASLIIGILSMLSPFAGPLLGIVAIILGVIGRKKLLEQGRSAGVAIGGIITGILGLLIQGAVTVSCVACSACVSAAADQNQANLESQMQQALNQIGQDMGSQVGSDLSQQLGVPGTGTVPGTGVVPGTVPGLTGAPSTGGAISLGMPTAGTFAPTLPIDATGKPYIDYMLTVSAPGTYRIDLMSADTMSYDPYIVLLLNGVEMGRDDDGGGNLQSSLSQMLAPGTYTVRVTKFGAGPVGMPVNFTLTVTQTG